MIDASPSVAAAVLVVHEVGHDVDVAAPASRRASCEPGSGSSGMILKGQTPGSRVRGSAASTAAGKTCSGSDRASERAQRGSDGNSEQNRKKKEPKTVVTTGRVVHLRTKG